MKRYRKPALEKKQVLSAVTADNGGGSGKEPVVGIE